MNICLYIEYIFRKLEYRTLNVAAITSKLGKKGEIIVKVQKKNLDFVNVALRVLARNNEAIAQAKATRHGNGLWSFRYPGTPPGSQM